jgi:hypothetical protein
MMSLLAGLQIGEMANEAIAHVVLSMTAVPEHLEMLIRDDDVIKADLLAALQGQELRTTAMLLDVAENKLDPGQWARQSGVGDAVGFVPTGLLYRVLYLRSDLQEAERYFAEGRAIVEGHGVNRAWTYWERGPVSMTAKLLSPAAVRIVTVQYPGYLAKARSTSLSGALVRYYRAKGEYPEKLDELAPAYIAAIPADPFDNKPMRYGLKGETAVVYSVGENLKDDGGAIDAPAGTSVLPLDVGLELPPPARP